MADPETDAEKGHIETESIVVTTEDGVVITGNRLAAFEARIIAKVTSRDHALFGAVGVLFVLFVGIAFFLGRLSNTVDSSDRILKAATGPAARQQNQEVLNGLLDNMNCLNQKNLQRFLDRLASAGVIKATGIDTLVDDSCAEIKPPSVTPTTTTTTAKAAKKATTMAPAVITTLRTTTTTARATTTTVTRTPSTTTTTSRAPPPTTSTTSPPSTTPTTTCHTLLIGDFCHK